MSTRHTRAVVVIAVSSSVLGLAALPIWPERPVEAQTAAGGEDADTMFRRLDTNKDGRISMADVQGYNRSMIERVLEMAGKKSDGAVMRDEFQKVYEAHHGGGGSRGTETTGDRAANTGAGGTRASDRSTTDAPTAPARDDTAPQGSLSAVMRWLDRDGDGRVSRAEYARLTDLWDRLDTNKDGTLDAAEIRAGERLLRETPARENNSSSSNTSGATERAPADRSAASDRAAAANTRDRVAAKPSRIEGTWRGSIMSPQGRSESEMELVVTGNRMEGRDLSQRRGEGNEGLGNGTFTMSGEGRTGNLDADGSDGQHRGKHYLGIYELDGETLRWCVSVRDSQRPRTLASGDGKYLMVLRRQPVKN